MAIIQVRYNGGLDKVEAGEWDVAQTRYIPTVRANRVC